MRVRGEQVLRAIVIAALAVMLWRSLSPSTVQGARVVSAHGVSPSLLRQWTNRAPSGIQLTLDAAPDRMQRAWLGALNGAGTMVTWTGRVTPLSNAAQPIASPTGGTRVAVAAPAGARLILSDEIGAIDTVQLRSSGAVVSLTGDAATVTANVGGSLASSVQSDSLLLRKVLVIGNATWESKFVVAALEEEGWKVDASIRVAPGTNVDQGAFASIDTAHYSAVIALDSAVAPFASRIAQFVRAGGGVVLTSEAASLDAMSPLRAGATGRPETVNTQRQINLLSLSVSPIAPKTDAVPLETRGSVTTVAARRFVTGRVVQIGYVDTWRWRLNGGDNGVRDHRRWWTGLLSDVAYAPRIPRSTNTGVTNGDDPAPVADLIARIGPAATGNRSAPERSSQDWMAVLFALALLALIGEVASRRLRGAA